MNLIAELDRIEELANGDGPQNEANTCHWVIVPLLQAIGYPVHEIHAQNPDGAGKYPDYTILKDKPQKWFLEAKAWRETLKDDHAHQALFSAYSNSAPWVVLTNGKDWRLYDSRLQGSSPAARLVACADLSKRTEMLELMNAISRESMLSGAIENLALTMRLRTVLQKQFATPDSLIMGKVTDVVRKHLDFPQATAAQVFSIVHNLLESSVPLRISAPALPELHSKEPVPTSSHSGQDRIYLLTPLRDEANWKVSVELRRLLDSGWYCLGDAAGGLKRIKPGDRIAFYCTGVGVVAEATIQSVPEIGEIPGVFNAEKRRWRFRISHPRYFFDRPIRLNDPQFRGKLDGFRGKDLYKPWSWFVQGTGPVSEHDFKLLTSG